MSWSLARHARALVCLALLAPALGRAQLPPQVTLEVSAPSSCPRTHALEADVARLVGATELADAAATEATLAFTHEGDDAHALALTIVTRGERYVRAMRLRSCEEAREAAALLIASALRPDLALAIADDPALPTPPVARSDRDARVGWSLALGGLLDLRSLPGATFGPTLGVGLSRRALRARADAHYLIARRSEDPSSALEAAIDLFAGALGVAWLLKLGALRVGPALSLEGGVVRGRGRGERAPREARLPWGALLAGAESELPVGRRVALTAGLALGLPLWRPAFHLADEPAFYTTAPVTARLTLGARLQLRPEK